MAKVQKNFRLEEKIIEALNLLADKGKGTELLETLIFREAIYKLEYPELEKLFGEDMERLMLLYAVSPK